MGVASDPERPISTARRKIRCWAVDRKKSRGYDEYRLPSSLAVSIATKEDIGGDLAWKLTAPNLAQRT